MSAWLCSDFHISVLAYFHANDMYTSKGVNVKEVGKTLFDENLRSVNHRYPQDAKGRQPKFRLHTDAEMAAAAADPVVILKLVNCLDYQSCETDDYKKTPAYKLLESIKSAAISKLAGYENAPWGVSNMSEMQIKKRA